MILCVLSDISTENEQIVLNQSIDFSDYYLPFNHLPLPA